MTAVKASSTRKAIGIAIMVLIAICYIGLLRSHDLLTKKMATIEVYSFKAGDMYYTQIAGGGGSLSNTPPSVNLEPSVALARTVNLYLFMFVFPMIPLSILAWGLITSQGKPMFSWQSRRIKRKPIIAAIVYLIAMTSLHQSINSFILTLSKDVMVDLSSATGKLIISVLLLGLSAYLYVGKQQAKQTSPTVA